MNKKNQWEFSFLHFIATGKFELLGILGAFRWRNIGGVCRFNIVQTSRPWEPPFFSIVQTSRSQNKHFCSKFAKIPHAGYTRTFKVPISSRGPLGHNIDSCINNGRLKMSVTFQRNFSMQDSRERIGYRLRTFDLFCVSVK